MNRRSFITSAGVLLANRSLHALLPMQKKQSSAAPVGKADHSLRIEPCTLEIGPGVTIKTLAYNGQVPGPLLRLREGVPVTIDVFNASAKLRPGALAWAGDRFAKRWRNGRRLADDSSRAARIAIPLLQSPPVLVGITPMPRPMTIFLSARTAGSLVFCWWKVKSSLRNTTRR